MSAPTDSYTPPPLRPIDPPAPYVLASYSAARGYARMRPDDIPPRIRRAAIDYALGGPPDDEGGYATPRVVSIFYLTNWREMGVPVAWDPDWRFALSSDGSVDYLNHIGFLRANVSPQWAVCARVYPVLRLRG